MHSSIEMALSLYSKHPELDREGRAHLLALRSEYWQAVDNPKQALQDVRESLEIFEQENQIVGINSIRLSACRLSLREPISFVNALSYALAIRGPNGTDTEGSLLLRQLGLGSIFLQAKEYPLAEQALQDGLAIAQRNHLVVYEGSFYKELVALYIATDRLDQAEELLIKLLEQEKTKERQYFLTIKLFDVYSLKERS